VESISTRPILLLNSEFLLHVGDGLVHFVLQLAVLLGDEPLLGLQVVDCIRQVRAEVLLLATGIVTEYVRIVTYSLTHLLTYTPHSHTALTHRTHTPHSLTHSLTHSHTHTHTLSHTHTHSHSHTHTHTLTHTHTPHSPTHTHRTHPLTHLASEVSTPLDGALVSK
jgi:hypothetical protein